MDREREERDALNGLLGLPPAIESLRAVLAKAFTADRAAAGRALRGSPAGPAPILRGRSARLG